ncbi:hypothetical protein [Burkholderia glumae]|uniref:hypothetical protein n=1 Tax=Burkholderia glumae TaxID=337 RepID=UPI0012F7BBAF|nr:hypothetical protein [Burkholderia glumae]MCM2491111.1 hypothetical protein [Burkholderia glumae]MCM2542104.1 hypothetical protein [Burkholderia glumae]
MVPTKITQRLTKSLRGSESGPSGAANAPLPGTDSEDWKFNRSYFPAGRSPIKNKKTFAKMQTPNFKKTITRIRRDSLLIEV